jgi:ribonuclease HI
VKARLSTDGGSRGNPGPAAYGYVLESEDGHVLAAEGEAIGVATNNVAEYRGLIAGLDEAARLGATEVEVLMDSKLVVEQMSGRWKVKHPDLVALHQEAKALALRFERIGYAWIPRAENSHADRLANEAMDAAAKPAEAPASPAGWIGARGAFRSRFFAPRRLRDGQLELRRQQLQFAGHAPGCSSGSRPAVPSVEACGSCIRRDARQRRC